MSHPTKATLRRVDGAWQIELPDDLVRSIGWTADQPIFVHRELTDGLWLSAQDQSDAVDQLVAFGQR